MPGGSYSSSDVSDYFEYILKTHGESTDNLSIRIYVNKIETRIYYLGRIKKFRIKTKYYLELLMSETIKLFRSNKRKIAKDENGANVPHLEITVVVLFHCNIVNNYY